MLPWLNLTLHLKPSLHEGLGPVDLGLNKVIQIYYLHELGPSHVNLMQAKCPKSHIYIYIYIFPLYSFFHTWFKSHHFLYSPFPCQTLEENTHNIFGCPIFFMTIKELTIILALQLVINEQCVALMMMFLFTMKIRCLRNRLMWSYVRL